MNKIQKKALYESIMKSVSNTIKKRLNEDESYEDYAYNINVRLDETGDESLIAEVIIYIHMMLKDILEIINQMDDGDISYDEVDAILRKIDKMICGR